MDEEQKKQVAVFRFGVIADFVTGGELDRGQRKRLFAEKCARKWDIPFSPAHVCRPPYDPPVDCQIPGGRQPA